ncbi:MULTISPECIES: hypothetical protein [Bradyrhizobium]|uniref:Uncharacterized protein n=1 Tax=Bradyrhizobium frederickii TaxID=2560054 RepID=A0A4Y9NNS4_9BRAD|nr:MULTISPECIES: hypothetical protein [Bradyrhizobium]TFV30620.1 hypothetical protein E4K66_34295 [Bradyrhizobium frederickii]TFV68992.1 hypothetical protein E4K64_34830 [Bradyrhizobium frederickii]
MENVREDDVLSARKTQAILERMDAKRGNEPPRPRSRQNVARAAFEISRANILILLPVPNEFDGFGVV